MLGPENKGFYCVMNELPQVGPTHATWMTCMACMHACMCDERAAAGKAPLHATHALALRVKVRVIIGVRVGYDGYASPQVTKSLTLTR